MFLCVVNTDGYRILVDRLWPRGISKETAAIDEWCKEVAPSNELRKSFGHEVSKFNSFRKAYFAELDGNSSAQELILYSRKLLKQEKVTFLYGAKDTERNNAVVLVQWLDKRL